MRIADRWVSRVPVGRRWHKEREGFVAGMLNLRIFVSARRAAFVAYAAEMEQACADDASCRRGGDSRFAPSDEVEFYS